jgi:hypothetical protein
MVGTPKRDFAVILLGAMNNAVTVPKHFFCME